MIATTRALALATTDMLRPRIVGVVAMGVGLTILLFIALQAGVFALAWRFGPETLTLPLIGTISLHHALGWGSLALFPILGFFLMAPVAAAFAGLFTDRVADTVEGVHYPNRVGKPMEIWDALMDSLALLLVVLAIGIVLLVTSPFLGPLAPLAFYGLNGWLLGREFFGLAARRHLDADAAQQLRERNGGKILTLGIIIALLLTVPLLAIIVPVLSVAAFTHLFHGISGDRDFA